MGAKTRLSAHEQSAPSVVFGLGQSRLQYGKVGTILSALRGQSWRFL